MERTENCNDQRALEQVGGAGGTRSLHTVYRPLLGTVLSLSTNPLARHILHSQLIPSLLKPSSSPFLGPKQNSCAFQLFFPLICPSNSKTTKCFTNYAFENVRVFFCIELTLFLKTVCLGNSLD